MSMAPELDYTHLSGPVQDLRPQYELAIGDVLKILWRRRLLIAAVTICTVAAALGVAAMMSRTYVGEALVQLKFGGEGGPNASAGAPTVTMDGVAVVESEAEIIRSRAIARRVLDRIEGGARLATPWGSSPASQTQRDAPEADRKVLALQNSLTVRTDGKTYLIHIAAAARDPLRAAMVANVFAEEYLKSRIEVSVAAAQRTSDWLASQVVGATAERQRTAEALRAFRARPDTIAADAGVAQIREQQTRDLLTQVSAAKAEGDRFEGRLQRLTEAVAAGRVPSAADLQGSADVQKLLDAEVTTRQEASRLSEMLGTKHPLYARAEKAHAVALQQLGDAVAAASDTARADLSSARDAAARLTAELTARRATAAQAETIDRTLRELETKDTAAQTDLDRLRDAHRQALALAELKPIAAQLVSVAEPLSIPTSPNMKVVGILSAIVGLAASLALIYLLEKRDNGFTTETQVAGEFGVRCGSMVPTAARGDTPAARRAHHRALKSLVIAAGLAEPRSDCAVVVVTSTVRREGKSELVQGLAATLSDLGRRVLVVDDTATLEPSGDEAAGAAGAAGAGGASGIMDGCDALPSTDRESDRTPALLRRARGDVVEALARGDRFGSWSEQARSQFDVMLVEAPAVLTDAEALRIARSADLVLFAVRWRSTPRQAAIAAFRQLMPTAGQQSLVVITEVDLLEHSRIGTRDTLYFSRRYGDRDGVQV